MMYLVIGSGWLIYWVWFNERYVSQNDLYLAVAVACVLFAAHHITIFAYRLLTDEFDSEAPH